MNNFESYIQGTTPVIVEFYADWSDASKLMEPVIQEVKEVAGDRAIIVRVNIDKNPEVAKQYGMYTVPGIAIFKDGYIGWHKNGLVAAHEILDHLMPEMG